MNRVQFPAIVRTSATAVDCSDAVSILNDVLLELERERSMRLEMESRLQSMSSSTLEETPDSNTQTNVEGTGRITTSERNDDRSNKEEAEKIISSLIKEVETTRRELSLSEEKVEASQKMEKSSSLLLKRARRDIVKLQKQKEYLIDIVNGITSGYDAIQIANAAHIASRPTLPSNIVRLLEVSPWEPVLEKYILATEEVYEWQSFIKGNGWSQNADFLSKTKTKDKDSNFYKYLSQKRGMADRHQEEFNNLLSPNAIVTDRSVTKIFDPENMCPLPENGTWKWIGRWKIDNDSQLRTDVNGWSYTDDAESLIEQNASSCFDSAGIRPHSKHQTPLRTIRCRKWTRVRVLVSYPSICKNTQHFLALREEVANATYNIRKLSEQLVAMHTKLTDYEDKLVYLQQVKAQVKHLESQIQDNNRKIQSLTDKLIQHKPPDQIKTSGSSFLQKNERNIQENNSRNKISDDEKREKRISYLPLFARTQEQKEKSDSILSLFSKVTAVSANNKPHTQESLPEVQEKTDNKKLNVEIATGRSLIDELINEYDDDESIDNSHSSHSNSKMKNENTTIDELSSKSATKGTGENSLSPYIDLNIHALTATGQKEKSDSMLSLFSKVTAVSACDTTRAQEPLSELQEKADNEKLEIETASGRSLIDEIINEYDDDDSTDSSNSSRSTNNTKNGIISIDELSSESPTKDTDENSLSSNIDLIQPLKLSPTSSVHAPTAITPQPPDPSIPRSCDTIKSKDDNKSSGGGGTTWIDFPFFLRRSEKYVIDTPKSVPALKLTSKSEVDETKLERIPSVGTDCLTDVSSSSSSSL